MTKTPFKETAKDTDWNIDKDTAKDTCFDHECDI